VGDHRPKITAHFEMHGHSADFDFGWCNWSDNGQGIDQRIVDWFAEQSTIAMARWRNEVDVYYSEQKKIETERLERKELTRLKTKYEEIT
jgi:hypothetical protein